MHSIVTIVGIFSALIFSTVNASGINQYLGQSFIGDQAKSQCETALATVTQKMSNAFGNKFTLIDSRCMEKGATVFQVTVDYSLPLGDRFNHFEQDWGSSVPACGERLAEHEQSLEEAGLTLITAYCRKNGSGETLVLDYLDQPGHMLHEFSAFSSHASVEACEAYLNRVDSNFKAADVAIVVKSCIKQMDLNKVISYRPKIIYSHAYQLVIENLSAEIFQNASQCEAAVSKKAANFQGTRLRLLSAECAASIYNKEPRYTETYIYVNHYLRPVSLFKKGLFKTQAECEAPISEISATLERAGSTVLTGYCKAFDKEQYEIRIHHIQD